MKLITRDTDYAVRALCYIVTSRRETVSVTTLVKELNMPRPFLRKILQILHKKKIVRASKGYGGGFSLALSADSIFLINLIEIFQGPLRLNECIFKKRICPNRNTCILKREIDAIERYVTSKLQSVTIKSLTRKRVNQWPKGR